MIEMIIVVVVLSIIAAVAVPRITHAVGYRQMESAIGRYISDVRYAQELARTTSRPSRIRIPAGKEYYNVETYYPTPGAWKPVKRYGKNVRVDLAGQDYNVRVINAVRKADQILEFDGFGYTTSTFSLGLVVHDTARMITCDGSTGVLEIEVRPLRLVQVVTELSVSATEVSDFLSTR